MSLKIKNLKEILDPQARHLFFDDEGVTEAIPFVRVLADYFVVSLENTDLGKKRKGYFVASNGRGIVRFEAKIEPVKGRLCRIIPNLSKLKLVNRREFNRYEFPYPVSVSLNVEGKFIKASLVNIGAGGLRMSVDRRLPTQVGYQFDITLPKGGRTFQFTSDGLVVYCEPEEDPHRFMTGVTFIAPQTGDQNQKGAYQRARKGLSEFLEK